MSSSAPKVNESDPPAPLRFERRQTDRWQTNLVATAFRLGGTRFGEMHPLRIVDFCDGGMGAMSHEPIEPGSLISVGFSAPGLLARRGTVLRCTPCGDGYRIAVQFEARLAA